MREIKNNTIFKSYMKQELHKIEKRAHRKLMVEQNFYDGRFRKRVIPDKKKKKNKEFSREWRSNNIESPFFFLHL